MTVLAWLISIVLVGTVVALVLFEWQYRQRPGNALVLNYGDWDLNVIDAQHYQLKGELQLTNQTDRLEIMVPELDVKAKLFSKESLAGVSWQTQVIPQHEDMPNRSDLYWFAYIVKVGKTTTLQVLIDIKGDYLEGLQSAWVRAEYMTYGPEGRIAKTKHIVVPLNFPDISVSKNWRSTAVADVLPIHTHLLSPTDDPVAVIQRYVAPHAKPGDIVTLGETPLALIQGRMRHPSTIKPGWVAKHICYYFLPTSSLATACGMQTLVDVVGSWRVMYAFIGGIVLRLLGQRGGFYQLAGDQARLIDDVTGTLPPYDQFIVLGPDDPLGVTKRIQNETGLACAIVDVNDLKAVKVLAASTQIPESFLTSALRDNPAGNADEQTPVVLIRPKEPVKA